MQARTEAFKHNCGYFWNELLHAIFRVKTSSHEYAKFSKVLDMFDVTMIGIGTTIGMGSYIFVGYFAKEIGPAMFISYILAAVLSVMNAWCYAEFLNRDPGSGGAYSQAYFLLSEFVAATIGWLLVLENVVASALSVRGLSEVIDVFTNKSISTFVKDILSFSNPFLGNYADVVGIFVVIIISIIVSFGGKGVTHLINICVSINISVLSMVLLVSGSKIDFSNWFLPPSEGCGNGGFMPFGIGSVWKGMSKAFYAYVGFDAAAHAGSEVSNSEKTIPTAILLSVLITTVFYVFQSFTYTLFWPYCDQNIDEPIQYAMEKVGVGIMKWITNLGCPIGLIGNLICGTYPLTRLIYSLAEDGLVYSFLGRINIYTKTPIFSLYMSAITTAIFALLFDKFRLLEITCLAALGVYGLVALCVLTLRYTEDDMEYGDFSRPFHKLVMNLEPSADRPTAITSMVVFICSSIIYVSSFPAQLIFELGKDGLKKGNKLVVSLLIAIILFYGFLWLIIVNQPMATQQLGVKVEVRPCLKPMLPIVCMLFNAHVCSHYSPNSWIILTFWMTIGTLIYFTYGIWNSKARNKDFLKYTS